MDFESEERVSTSAAFVLWLACLFGLHGIHRFYMGKWFTGLIYLFTFGLLGVGQIVDLVRLRGLVAAENDKRARLSGRDRRYLAGSRRQIGDGMDRPVESTPESMRMKLLGAAAARGGKLSVTEGVMATGRSFSDVEAELDSMARSGYVGLDVDEETGRVTYAFGELTK